LAGNKTDTLTGTSAAEKFSGLNSLFISARQNKGIAELKEKLFRSVIHQELSSENTIITNSRHYTALQEVSKSLSAIKTGLDNKISGDLLTPDIHRCLHYISEITGDISNETILDYVFSKFCIGK
jgi:tRNA modification GTPase